MNRRIKKKTRGVMPQSNKCYNCNNFNHFGFACELWHEKIKKKGKCDFYNKD